MGGKRVAVVGTGASAMQFVPAIAPEVEHLTIFQRSRHWVTPNPVYHRPVTDAREVAVRQRALLRGLVPLPAVLEQRRPHLPGVPGRPGMADARHLDQPAEREAATHHDRAPRARAGRHARPGRPGAPRLPAAREAHAAGQRLVPDAPARQRRAGQRAGSRASPSTAWSRPPATSTRPTSSCSPPASTRTSSCGRWRSPRRGVRLHDEWGEDPRAYLGITVPGFPNLFCLYGPNTNPVVGSVVFMLECQVDYVVQSLARCSRAATRRWSAAATCTTSTTSGSTPSTSTWSGVTRRSTATTTTCTGGSPPTRRGDSSTTGA